MPVVYRTPYMGARVQHQPVYRRLCKLLRQWRCQAGFSQAHLAELMKKPPSYIHKCEVADRRIDPIEFVRWYQRCGISGEQAIIEIEKILQEYEKPLRQALQKSK